MKQNFQQDSMYWFLSILVVLILMLSSTNKVYANVNVAPDQVYEAGEIIINKTAVPASLAQDNREYVITLSAGGSSVSRNEPVEIILIIDTSDSMSTLTRDTNETRLDAVKKAALAFADKALSVNSESRIAIVNYSGDRKGRTFEDDKLVSFDNPFNDASTAIDFSNDLAAISLCLDELSAGGGTNMEAGLYQARQELLATTSSNQKIVVLISDGQPTHAYSSAFVKVADSYMEDFAFYPAEYIETYGITIGDGENYNPIYRQKAIAEAILIKNEFDAKIFTVGISDQDNNSEVMNEVLNPSGDERYQEQYYEVTDSEGLNSALANISRQISAVAENAIIIDVIGADFDLVEGSAEGAVIDGQRLMWDVGVIGGGRTEERSVSFRVRAKDHVSGELFTNNIAYLYFDLPAVNMFYDDARYDNPDLEIGREKRLTYDRPVVKVSRLNSVLEDSDQNDEVSEQLVQFAPELTTDSSKKHIDDEITKTGEDKSYWYIGIGILTVGYTIAIRELKRKST